MCLLKKLKGNGFYHVYMVPSSNTNTWCGGGMDFTSLHDAQIYQRVNPNAYNQYAITWRRQGEPGWLVVERNR